MCTRQATLTQTGSLMQLQHAMLGSMRFKLLHFTTHQSFSIEHHLEFYLHYCAVFVRECSRLLTYSLRQVTERKQRVVNERVRGGNNSNPGSSQEEFNVLTNALLNPKIVNQILWFRHTTTKQLAVERRRWLRKVTYMRSAWYTSVQEGVVNSRRLVLFFNISRVLCSVLVAGREPESGILCKFTSKSIDVRAVRVPWLATDDDVCGEAVPPSGGRRVEPAPGPQPPRMCRLLGDILR